MFFIWKLFKFIFIVNLFLCFLVGIYGRFFLSEVYLDDYVGGSWDFLDSDSRSGGFFDYNFFVFRGRRYGRFY